MKRILMIVGIVAAVWGVANAETLENRVYRNHMNDNRVYLAPYGEWAKQEVKRNVHKDILHLQKVINKAANISIGKTIDTDEYVITICDDTINWGKRDCASFWLNNNGSIRSVSPY